LTNNEGRIGSVLNAADIKPIGSAPQLEKQMSFVEKEGLAIDQALHDFLVREAMPGTGVEPERFFKGLSSLVHDLAPKNRALLARRDELQAKIDAWYRDHGAPADLTTYEGFLKEIGYLVPEGDAFSVSTENVDPEIAKVAGPQLVVPVMNARYALNAANARWGSLYDALYGTDAISDEDGAEKGRGYNPKRGAKVIAWGRKFLNESAPIEAASGDTTWENVGGFSVENGTLAIALSDGALGKLKDSTQFAGYRGEAFAPKSILLVKNGLHLEIVIDRQNQIGASDAAGIADIVLESALTTIQDCEDSSPPSMPRQGRGLSQLARADEGRSGGGFEKGGATSPASSTPTAPIRHAGRRKLILPGRSLMLVRNVGHLMTNPAIRDPTERIAGRHARCLCDRAHRPARHRPEWPPQELAAGSIYVVKPKMHGPEEVAFACEIFGRVEQALGMKPGTRSRWASWTRSAAPQSTSRPAIRAAKERVVFINTGFLDRTGDEIHTSMEAGPMIRKGDMQAAWIQAYETGTSISALPAVFPAVRRSARACGRCPI
jgi:malate synthase